MPVYVDFSEVRPEHRQVDARLENWARWARAKGFSGVSPTFRLYQTPQHWRGVADGGQPVNSMDAVKMQKLTTLLPEKHRLALAWCYVYRGNPKRFAQQIGESMQGLMVLIHNARQMLVNHGA